MATQRGTPLRKYIIHICKVLPKVIENKDAATGY